MRSRLVAALTLAAAALAGPLAAPAAPARAATGGIVPPGEIGYDVSFPQCAKDGDRWTERLGRALPAEPAFAVVGVNEGLGNTNNPCFAAQLQWALGATAVTSQPRVGLYVNSQNPGTRASWWPTGNATKTGTVVRNPFGTCTGSEGAACAWVYGYSMAEADVTPAVRKVPVPRAYTWWLDVETSNDWSSDQTANRAVLEGMATAFQQAGAQVGVYSTHQQWDEIVGPVPASSPLAALPSWLSAAVTERGAAENCTRAPLAAGRVVLAQWTDGSLDYDIACRQLSAAPLPTLTGKAVVGARLAADAGRWGPGPVALSYQWLRDGFSITGATKRTYVLQRGDAGTRIAVRVTGTKLAYNRAVRASVAVEVQPRPAIATRNAPTPATAAAPPAAPTGTATTTGTAAPASRVASPAPHIPAPARIAQSPGISVPELTAVPTQQGSIAVPPRFPDAAAAEPGIVPLHVGVR